MSWYLMNQQLGKFATWMPKCRDFGYENLPRHFQEASLVYVYATRKPLYLAGYAPRDDVARAIEDFSQTMKRYGANKQAAFEELAKRHYGSYFFYNTYAQQGQGG